MRCPYCGGEVNAKEMRCEYCGSQIEKKSRNERKREKKEENLFSVQPIINRV